MKILIFSAAFVFLFFIHHNKSYSQKLKGEDERIIITVDSVERADSSYTYGSPSEGNDFIFINITVVEKRDLKIKNEELRLTKTQLIDDIGETHSASEEQLNITIPEKKTGYLLFEMPKDAIPVQLNYFYQYREESPKSQEIKIGQIDIILS